jgi:hypothetical protein
MSFLSRLGLPENTIKASAKTQLNGKDLGWDTKNKLVGNGHFKLGMEIDKLVDGNFHFVTWTVADKRHLLSSDCIVTPLGILVEGKINAFEFIMTADQSYINELMNELEHKQLNWN